MAEVTIEYKDVEVTLKIDLDTAERLVSLVGKCAPREGKMDDLYYSLVRAGVKTLYKATGSNGETIPVITFKL